MRNYTQHTHDFDTTGVCNQCEVAQTNVDVYAHHNATLYQNNKSFGFESFNDAYNYFEAEYLRDWELASAE